MVIKDNQRALHSDLETLFGWRPGPGRDLRHFQSVSKGHGRVETRTLYASIDLNDYLDWASVGQALHYDSIKDARARLALDLHTACSIAGVPQERFSPGVQSTRGVLHLKIYYNLCNLCKFSQ
jgi:hypothetical protein